MKRKHLMAFALAGMLAMANAMPAFAVGSITTDPIITPPTPTPEPTPAPVTTTVTTGNTRSERTSDQSNIVVRTINRLAGTVTTSNPAIAVIMDASTPLAAAPAAATAVNPDEVQMPAGVQTNASGDTIIGDKAVGFVRGENATAGLPANVVGAINNINAGQPLETALNTSSLSGYHALTGTHAISVKNAATGQAATGNVEMSLYVPNLVNGLDGVSVLFYDNATGNWVLIPATRIDTVNKTVTVTVTGSGTLAVVYKRQ